MKIGLSKSHFEHFNEFLLHSILLLNHRRISILYRGDKLRNIFSRLNIFYEENAPNYEDLLNRLFMVGEKGKHFYSEELTTLTGRIVAIDEISEDLAAFIFDHLNKATKSKRERDVQYFGKQGDFSKYFADKKNKNQFITDFAQLSFPDAQFYRIHYLTLLHQLAAVNYKSKSHFISTTRDYNVAHRFAETGWGKGFILYSWKPSITLRRKQARVTLPTYRYIPYRWQKETSVFAGILPHFIVAIEIVGERKLFINPNLFSSAINEKLFVDGFEIDQRRFDEIVRLTNYSHGYEQIGNKIMERR